MSSIMRTTTPQNIIIGTFFFLAAVVFAVAPLPIMFRSLGIVLSAYLAFTFGGMPFAYLSMLLAPVIGLITGDTEWLIMLPIVLSSGLLGMLGLEYAWRYAAIAVSPLLYITPQVFVWQASQIELFAVSLPWDPNAASWISVHLLTALAGVLVAVYLDRRQEQLEPTQP